MNIGKAIRIHLVDGSVSGIRHAEIVNWTGQAVSCPRSKIKALSSWEESKKPGVYFLFGVDENSGEDAVYIGEAGNIFNRLQNHIANKDFWNEVVFFTSKDKNLNARYIKYLESRIVKLTKLCGRDVVLNGNDPQLPESSRSDRDAIDEFLANLKILLGVLGHKTLECIYQRKTNTNPEQESHTSEEENTDVLDLFLKVKGINAQAHLTDEGIVVLATSRTSREVKDSLSAGYKRIREQLIQNGTLDKTSNGYVFTKNQLFKSPSQAAAIIVGYSINGRHNWQTKNGITLKSIEELNAKSN